MFSYNYYDDYDPEYDKNEFIEKEMHYTKLEVQTFIKKHVMHSNFEDMSKLIAYGYFESFKPAEVIAKELNLGKLELLAILEDFEAFKEEYLKQNEEYYDFD